VAHEMNGPSREFLIRAAQAEEKYGTPAIGHHHFSYPLFALSDQVRDIEVRCEAAERKLAEVRATLIVNLKPGRLDRLTAWEAVAELLFVLFRERPNGEETQ